MTSSWPTTAFSGQRDATEIPSIVSHAQHQPPGSDMRVALQLTAGTGPSPELDPCLVTGGKGGCGQKYRAYQAGNGFLYRVGDHFHPEAQKEQTGSPTMYCKIIHRAAQHHAGL